MNVASLTSALPLDQPMRASLFNLVTYMPLAQKQTAMREITQNMIEKLPIRTISILPSSDLSTPLQIQTTPHILQRGSHRIACEEVTIHASTEELSKVPFAIMPYFIPD